MLGAAVILSAVPVHAADDPDTVQAIYVRADAFLRWNAEKLVTNDPQAVNWSPDSRIIWYRVRTTRGVEIRQYDIESRRVSDVFDPRDLSKLLAAQGCPIDAVDLPIANVRPVPEGWAFSLTAGCKDGASKSFVYRSVDRQLHEIPALSTQPNAIAPDGKHVVVAADYNLSLADAAGKIVAPLSRDGISDNYVGSPPDICCTARLWGRAPDFADALWSPNGKLLLTYRSDTRAVRKSRVLPSLAGLGDTYTQALPGDAVLPILHPLIFDMATDRQIVVDGVAPVALLASEPGTLDAKWAPDSRTAYILSVERDARAATLHAVDAADGKSRPIFSARSTLPLSVAVEGGGWQVSHDGNVLLWSEQPGDANRLARYDLKSQRRLNFVTPDTLQFVRLIAWDENAGLVYFVGQGGPGLNPYFRQLYRVGADGRGLRRLTPEPLDHDITLSPDGRLFVDITGSPTTPNRTLLRRIDGGLVATLEQEDASRLLATGWRPPIPVTTQDASARFTLHGLLYLPANFDPRRRYPILDLIYPGPSEGPTRSRRFTVDASSNPQSLAQLGVVVLALDASGTGGRGKAFQQAWHTDLGNLGLADHVRAIRDLSARYPFLDMARVGILGVSAGGDAAARAMFTYPDTFKVGVSVAGSYDYRQVLNLWGERYIGQLKRRADGSDNYPSPTWLLADRLKGKLLLAFGGRDDNVNPAIPLAMIDALEKAQKPFDLILVPDQAHWPWENPWFEKRLWDFLLANLRGIAPAPYTLAPKPPDPGYAP